MSFSWVLVGFRVFQPGSTMSSLFKKQAELVAFLIYPKIEVIREIFVKEV